MPGVISGFLLAFTMSVDDFVITHFTRGVGINNAFHTDILSGESGDQTDPLRVVNGHICGRADNTYSR